MSSRPSSGGPLHLALVLVLLGALVCLAGPVQAIPAAGSSAAGPFAGIFDWLQDLMGDLGWGPADGGEEPEAPRPSFLPEGSCVDPNGNSVPCPESDSEGPTLDTEDDSTLNP